jgi:hypothetical protein
MCNLYKMTKTVDEVARLFRAVFVTPDRVPIKVVL